MSSTQTSSSKPDRLPQSYLSPYFLPLPLPLLTPHSSRIINPSTGHCLTALSYNATRTQTGFTTCSTNPSNLAQLWQTDQQVTYPLGGSISNPSSYGSVDFNIVEVANTAGFPPDPPYLAWALSADFRGIEVKQFGYTQDGVLAELLQG